MKTLHFIVKEFFWGAVNAFVMMAAGVLIAGFFIYKYQTPDVRTISNFRPHETSIIYDRTGTHILYKIHGEENRKVLAHDEIPDSVRIATVAAEDKDFYSHFGVDFVSIMRAIKVNYEEKGMYQGGSTITQQLARNLYLSREKTLRRKLMETIIAIKIERNLTKDEILDAYLNEVPYGSNAYGIQSAAEVFFGKNASELTLNEAVFLAALPKAPTYYSPYGNHREKLYARYKDILKKIENQELISVDQIAEAKNEDVFLKVKPFREPIDTPHFVFYAIEKLEEKYGRELLEKGGFHIITSLDYDLQKAAEQSVQEGVARNMSRGATNAALVALDPKSGQILAMVGSRNYFDQSIDGQVNVTIQPRQPGSSFKPIVYATAFEKGFQPETMVTDSPTNFGPDGNGKNYVPRNYDGKFHGTLPMRKTLAMSLNIPAIKTLAMSGLDNVINMAHRLGITTINDRKRYGLSLAIGGAEVRPIDMASAFGVFANEGKKFSPSPILEVIYQDGSIYEKQAIGEQVIDSEVARKINSILSDNDARSSIFGKNNPLYIPGKIVAAKTGTTQEFRDAWTVGYTPNIAVGVWAGNNDSRPMISGSDGVFVAAPIWRSFMDKVLNRYPDTAFIDYQHQKQEKTMISDEELDKIKNDRKDEKKTKKHG
ncbi:MAG: PBP1A family penicillin-binding protein [Parcubacteria group bacterium]|jgi:1A family penicillin-binding protein